MDDEIRREISQCNAHIQLLIGLNDGEGARAWFKELCCTLTDLLIHVKRKHKNNSNSTSFYFTQLTTYLSLLIPVFSSQDFTETIDVRRYVQKQLTQCLEGVESASANACLEENFTNQIDSSLEKLSLIDVNDGRSEALSKYEEARERIVQALCHAMSIAHVGYPQDFQAVKGGCKSVLNALDSLHQELQKADVNVAMCNLSIDSCYDKLCNLERRINTTILTLCLKIFSQHSRPLELLYESCENSSSRGNERNNELIADFDLQVDRIMQVGWFAVASSPDIRCRVKMQSHLACLEALESELVPNLKTYRLDETRSGARLVSVLKRHWLKEVQELKRALYSVIDPFAFGQIALEELKQSVDVVFESARRNNEGVLKQNSLETIVSETEALIDVVTVSFGDAEPPIEVKNLLGDLKQVVHEIKIAIQLLLVENKPDKAGGLRIKKRCKIMLSIAKKLVQALSEGNPLKDTLINAQNKQHCPLSTDDSKQTERNAPGPDENDNENKFLNHIINKGKEILKERRTPLKVTFFDGLTMSKPPSASSLKRRSLHFSYSKVRDGTSIDLQLTELLSGISSSFT